MEPTKEPYRKPTAIITHDELMTMSPEAIAALFKAQASRLWDARDTFVVDEFAEHALLGRGDPLIDLTLARYGRSSQTLLAIFKSPEPSRALRLAVLSNTRFEQPLFPGFPVNLFGNDAKTADWLESTPEVELEALLGNTRLSDTFLRSLLGRRKEYANLSDKRLITIVHYLAKNERMNAAYDGPFDAVSDAEYHLVFDAAWRLAASVPITERWARALDALYENLYPDVDVQEPLEIAARWDSGHAEDESTSSEEQASAVESGWLTPFEGVRRGLARTQLGRFRGAYLHTMLNSDDRAVRAAAYRYGRMDELSQLSDAVERDGALVVNEALENPLIWRSEAGRDVLKTLAWAQKNDDLAAVNRFKSWRAYYQKTRPQWFRDEEKRTAPPARVVNDDEMVAGFLERLSQNVDFEQVATKAYVLAIVQNYEASQKSFLSDLKAFQDAQISRENAVADQVRKTIATVSTKVNWAIGLSLGVLAIALLRHL